MSTRTEQYIKDVWRCSVAQRLCERLSSRSSSTRRSDATRSRRGRWSTRSVVTVVLGGVWLALALLTGVGVDAGDSGGLTGYGGWNSDWDTSSNAHGGDWQNAFHVTEVEPGWHGGGSPAFHHAPPTYKVRTVTKVVKKVPKRVTHTYTTYEDDHEPWLSLHVNHRLRKPTIILNGWAKDGKFGLNVNIH